MPARSWSPGIRPVIPDRITRWERIMVFHAISPSQQPSACCRDSKCAAPRRWADSACARESLPARRKLLPVKIVLPLTDDELLEQVHRGIQLHDRGLEVRLVAGLLRLDRPAVL